MEEIFIKLNLFKDIIFIEEGHIYFNKGKQVLSTTTRLKEFQKPFDEKYWSLYTALKRSGNTIPIWKFKPDENDYSDFLEISVEEILKEWEYKRVLGTTIGSAIHNYLENLWGKKILNINCNEPKYNILKVQADNFYQDFKDRYIPVSLECVIGTEFICGQIDGLFYDLILKGLVLIDYKTDKEIKYKNKYQKLLGILKHLQDCNFVKYGLQTSIYKKIWEEITNIPILETKIIWFNDENENYEIIEPIYYKKELELLWQQFQK